MARELFVAMRYEETVDQLLAVMMPQMIAAENRRYRGLTPAQQTAISDSIREAMAALSPEMQELMATAYARVFTVEELRGLRDFYNSPLGQAFMRKSPEATEQSMAALMALVPRIEQEMMTSLCRRLDCGALQRSRVS